MGGRSFPRAFKIRVKYIFIRRTFIEEFERHVKEGSGNGQLSSYGPPLGNLKGVRLPGLFERQTKEGSGNGTSLIKLRWAPFFGSRLC
jgi:hypothetical protein